MGGIQQAAVGTFLWLPALLVVVATVQGAGASFLIPSLDVSFQLAVQGLGAATFYTFQQQLPHPTLPYAIHDEWVQYAYPDGTAAVYNVAQVSPAASSAAKHGSLSLDREQLNNQCSNDVYRSCREGKYPEPSRTCRGDNLLPFGAQEYVAVRANDAAGYLTWFQQYSASMLDRSNTEAPELAQFTRDVDALVLAQLHTTGSSTSVIESVVEPGQVEQVYAEPSLTQQTHTDLSIRQSPFSGTRSKTEYDTCKYRNFMLYLGMSIPLSAGGGTVTVNALQSFLDAEVSPRVQVFTIIKAEGFWEGETEQTVVLEVISDANNAYVAVQEIAEAYKRYFKQQAVLVKEQVCPVVQFI